MYLDKNDVFCRVREEYLVRRSFFVHLELVKVFLSALVALLERRKVAVRSCLFLFAKRFKLAKESLLKTLLRSLFDPCKSFDHILAHRIQAYFSAKWSEVKCLA